MAPAVTAYGSKRLAAKSIQRQGAALMEAYTCACIEVCQSWIGPHAFKRLLSCSTFRSCSWLPQRGDG